MRWTVVMIRALALGLLVGFSIAASPGPMFFLVLRRTVARGWPRGLLSGLGVATGDAIYAALAAFGVAAITNVLLGQRRWIGLVGGVAIALIGLRTLRAHPHPGPPPQAEEGNPLHLVGAYGSMMALTLGNPATILSFIAVFAGFGLRVGAGWQPAVALVAGVMLGSALWWVGLTAAVSVIRQRLTPGITRGIGIVAGLTLIGFGAVAAVSSLARPG
jgi:threonine/homoserine/homoserine lactone efflux protein